MVLGHRNYCPSHTPAVFGNTQGTSPRLPADFQGKIIGYGRGAVYSTVHKEWDIDIKLSWI